MPMTPTERDSLIQQHEEAIELSKRWMASTTERVEQLRQQKLRGIPVDSLISDTLDYSNSQIAGRHLLEKRLARLRTGLDADDMGSIAQT
jgi:hypothetical protein